MNDSYQKEKLVCIAGNIPAIYVEIPTAIGQVQQVMTSLLKKYPGKIVRGRFRGSAGKGTSSGSMIAYDHYVEYFSFESVGIGLGYNLSDWVYSGKKQFQWRVAIIPPDNIRDSILKKIEPKIDGVWFIPQWKKGNHFGHGDVKKNQQFPFLPVLEENLSSKGIFNPDMVADIIMEFLDKLFK